MLWDLGEKLLTLIWVSSFVLVAFGPLVAIQCWIKYQNRKGDLIETRNRFLRAVNEWDRAGERDAMWRRFLTGAADRGDRLVYVRSAYQMAVSGTKCMTESYWADNNRLGDDGLPTLTPDLSVRKDQDTWFRDRRVSAGCWYAVPRDGMRVAYGPHNGIRDVLYVNQVSDWVNDTCRDWHGRVLQGLGPRPQPWQYGLKPDLSGMLPNARR
ncbi:hypothetical protein CSQ85_09180 [Bifidobacterium rousetti]|uniref:hypothetical protein n=1 Tax=Bifidobacterium rousetti TaxID=2045439 RepID=UPI00123BBF07|nr:hypothetical protein [Bifidobacterium rousetti]KAA8818323.1 hypothetical protein CSQ85_09180 [Bifidobacterium rousetti]